MDTSTLYLTVDHPNFEIEQSLTELYRVKANDYNDAHKNPGSASAYHDSGFDLFVPHTIRTDGNWGGGGNGNTPYVPITLDHHVRIASYASVNQYPRPYYLYPRSSISKTPFRLANSVGIIDAGYRGHVIAKVDDIRRFYGGKEDVDDEDDDAYASYYGEGNEDRNGILKGTRLFQVCSHNLLPFDNVVLLNKNDPRMQTDVSTRGEGGFGSTNLSFSGE